MKQIGIISDLHIDQPTVDESAIHTHLATLIRQKQIDMLLIGGDISNDYQRTFHFVEKLQIDTGVPVYFIPGNHDYWQTEIEKDAIDSWKIYEEFKHHPQSLIERTLDITTTTSVVGHSFWYNHAIYADRFSPEKIERGFYKGGWWQDKLHTNWGMSDKALSTYFTEIVDKQLAKINANRQIILLSHMVVIPEYTVPLPNRIFDFFNAYIATDDVAKLIDRYPITHVSMGHVHFRHQLKKDNGIHYLVNCLGYKKEWRSNKLAQELEDAMAILQVE